MSYVIKYAEIISDNKILRGLVHWNGFYSDNIIIIHGYFSANKIGPNRLFFNVAQHLADLGYNVYRFDLSGMGESDGEIQKITFQDHKTDILNIYKYVFGCSKKRIYMISHCMGVPLSFSTVIDNDLCVEKIVALSPFITANESVINLWREEKDDIIGDEIPDTRKGLRVNYSFFYENTSVEKFTELCTKLKQRSVSILSEDDQYIPIRILKAVLTNTQKDYLIINNADHNFTYHASVLIDIIEHIIKGESQFG